MVFAVLGRTVALGRLADVEHDEVKARLLGERARLEGVKENFDEEHLDDESEQESLAELSSFDQHEADIGTETFEREKDLSILEQVEAELADVEYAIRRLDEGTYGTCEACGRPIDQERLEAMPATRLCRDDQLKAEREARAGSGQGQG
jgi:RNA polymerase-binding transcription factor DksA